MSSEKFENLQDDLRALNNDIRRKIENKLQKSWGEEKKKLSREIEKQIEEANSLLLELDGEIRLAPQPFRVQMTAKVRSYREDIDRLTSRLHQSGTTEGRVRQDLFAPTYAGSDLDPVEASQRARLLQTGEIIGRTSDSIGRSHRIAAETDQIGNEVIEELGQQRESLIRTKERLSDTDDNLSKSRKILRTMYRRVMTNKLILGVIILIEAGILAGVLYWKISKHH